MIKTEFKSNIKFPKEFINQDDMSYIAERIFIPLMRNGITTGVGVDGMRFPEPENKLRSQSKILKRTFTKKGNIRATAIGQIGGKGLLGFSKKILIDTGKLFASFRSKRSGKFTVKVELAGDRADVGKYLQIEGIKTKRGKKFYTFFGISDGMEKDAMQFAKDKISKVIGQFNGK